MSTVKSLGPPLRVTPVKSPHDSPKENVRESLIQRSTPKSQTSISKKARPKTAVQRAQEEALRAFGGKSLGHVLTEAQPSEASYGSNSQQTAANSSSVKVSKARPLTRLERSQLEAERAFQGADFDQLTNAVKQRLQSASEKHLEGANPNTQQIIRKKLDLVKEEAAAIWGNTDLGEVDFKPGLSRVELDQIELVKKMSRQELVELQERDEAHRIKLEEEEKARQERDEARRLRFEAQQRMELEKEKRFEMDRIERREGKKAPFMKQSSDPTDEAAQNPTSVASDEPYESVEEEESLDQEEPATPERTFKTAVSSLVGTPADGANESFKFLDESMGELLDRISMSNLSAELTPSESCDEQQREEVLEELTHSLPKHRTPLHRLPFHDAPDIDAPLREALEEISQQNVAREQAALESLRSTLDGYTVKQLKEELKERDLKVSGVKAELIDRLIEYHEEHKDDANGAGRCHIM